MTQEQTTSDAESMEQFQSQINNLTTDMLQVAEGAPIPAMVAAGMNVVLNGVMALKETPEVPDGFAEAMVLDIRKMVDYIESQLKPAEITH